MSDTKHDISIKPLGWVDHFKTQGFAARCVCRKWESKPYDNPRIAREIGNTHLTAMWALNLVSGG